MVVSSMMWTKPGGSPLGDTSTRPFASVVATKPSGACASQCCWAAVSLSPTLFATYLLGCPTISRSSSTVRTSRRMRLSCLPVAVRWAPVHFADAGRCQTSAMTDVLPAPAGDAADSHEHSRTGLSADALRRGILDHLRYSIGRPAAALRPEHYYRATALAVRDRMQDNRVASTQTSLDLGRKVTCYLSAEFLMGPQLGSNLLNLGIEKQTRAALAELGQDLDEVLACEEEPGLGNGGLGWLAACYLDSLATLERPAIGYGIRYEFGIFDQEIHDGWQVEKTDNWLVNGNPWEAGKRLRLLQQYFFVSCSLQHVLHIVDDLADLSAKDLPQRFALQLNDTHPSIGVAELMRILVDERQLDWDEAWAITVASFGYTNHTLLPEALETWPLAMFAESLPRHLEIIYEIKPAVPRRGARQVPGRRCSAAPDVADRRGQRQERADGAPRDGRQPRDQRRRRAALRAAQRQCAERLLR